jgi:hypothetical protein
MVRVRGVAAALLLAISAAFFGGVLFSPEITIPWDFRAHHYFLAAAYADALAEGVLPLWEPFSYCGRPLLPTRRLPCSIPACGSWPWPAARIFSRTLKSCWWRTSFWAAWRRICWPSG